ncbi:MAG: ATP-dependent DNA ligase, partial [Acetobacteraceae bacterium]|nr:ATP-dependent DNA ligase [Acetobacteraceae bacterium]
PEWLFEPKHDGFRCVIFRDEDIVHLQSRRQRPLERYFPEMADACLAVQVPRYVLDGELIIPGEPFDTLQLRLHPAASRIAKLSKEYPAAFIAFDLLADETGGSLLDRPFAERRKALEAFFERLAPTPRIMLSAATTSAARARQWLTKVGQGLDGIVAKRLDLKYQPGRRSMQKYKIWQTVDCVVGGLYYKKGTETIEYLLLGLYDDAGQLNYVGRCGIGENAKEITQLLKPLIGSPGFTGNAPGGRSRWSTRERIAIPLQPKLVAEVSADHIEAGRFRHGSRLIRWREDKAPRACTMDQIERK